jgi:hypothetical protein
MLLWFCAMATGMWLLWRYAETPGLTASPRPTWPEGTAIEHAAANDTLVMFCHPHCPCTRASMAELERIVAKSQGSITPWIVFYKPAGAESNWQESDLWRTATAIPGAHVMVDESGTEARRFGATTSGQTFLYDCAGQLLFDGGITSARGHEGDNAGESAIVQLANEGETMCRMTPVYGCPIVESNNKR